MYEILAIDEVDTLWWVAVIFTWTVGCIAITDRFKCGQEAVCPLRADVQLVGESKFRESPCDWLSVAVIRETIGNPIVGDHDDF